MATEYKRISDKTAIAKSSIEDEDVMLIQHQPSADASPDMKVQFAVLAEKVNDTLRSELTSGTTTVKKATSATTADSATSADKATGDSDGNEITSTYAKLSGGTFTGDVVIQGDLTVEGESYETHTEKLYTKNDLIITRDGATEALASDEYTGIEAEKYDGTNNGLLVFSSDGVARVGDEGDTQPLATREESPTDGGYAKWDGTNNKFVTETLGGASAKEVDTSISSGTTSTNLPTSKAVADYVDSQSGNTVDTALSTTSENAVQNKAIATRCNELQNQIYSFYGAAGSAGSAYACNTSSYPVSLVHGKTLIKMTFSSSSYASTTTTAPTESTSYYPRLKVYTSSSASSDIPIVVKRGGKLFLMPPHKIISGGYSNSYYRWWDTYTTLDMVYLEGVPVYKADGSETVGDSMKVLLVRDNPTVLSYYSSTASYEVKADGLITQWGASTSTSTSKDASKAFTLPIVYSVIPSVTALWLTSGYARCSLSALSESSFTIRGTDYACSGYSWKAIGY